MVAATFTEFDLSGVLIAIVGLLGIYITVSSRRNGKKIDEVHREVRTNDGKRNGEYTELTATRLDELEASTTGLLHAVSSMSTNQALARAMWEGFMLEARVRWDKIEQGQKDHEVSDETRFDRIESHLTRQDGNNA